MALRKLFRSWLAFGQVGSLGLGALRLGVALVQLVQYTVQLVLGRVDVKQVFAHRVVHQLDLAGVGEGGTHRRGEAGAGYDVIDGMTFGAELLDRTSVA